MNTASSQSSIKTFAFMMQQCGVLFCTTNVHDEPRSKYFRKYAYGRRVPDMASALPTRISCGIAAACVERLIVSTPRGSKCPGSVAITADTRSGEYPASRATNEPVPENTSKINLLVASSWWSVAAANC